MISTFNDFAAEISYMSDRKFLFVDDEPQILSMLGKVFSKAGYQPRMAQSGESVLSILQNEDIHVMFFDLNIPHMSGIELCRRVRRERPMDLIFALTGYAGPFELSECRQAGFDDYFSKPADMQLLKDTASMAFEKRRRWKNKG
jgi:DNA-binding response OmpR family regulator